MDENNKDNYWLLKMINPSMTNGELFATSVVNILKIYITP